jgi:hypothetical protein
MPDYQDPNPVLKYAPEDDSEDWRSETAEIPVYDFDESSVGVMLNIDATTTPVEVFN